MAAKGFPVVGQGQVMSKSTFSPADNPGQVYTSIEVGYMGGAVRIKTTPAQWQPIEEGADVDFRARCHGGKKGIELHLEAIGQPGSIFKKAA